MTETLTPFHPKTLDAMQVPFPPQTANERGREQFPDLQAEFDSLSDQSLPLHQRVATALGLLELGASVESAKGYYTSTYFVSPEPQKVGEYPEVYIDLMSTKDHLGVGVVVGIGKESRTGTYNLNKETGAVEYANGSMADDPEAFAIISAGLSDMVHDRLGLPRAEIVAKSETPEEESFNNGYEAAQFLIDGLLEDAPSQLVYGEGNGALHRRQATINMGTGHNYVVEQFSRGQGEFVPSWTYVTVTTQQGTVQFQLGSESVLQMSKGKEWRDRRNGINTIDDVFYLFAEDLVKLDALRDAAGS